MSTPAPKIGTSKSDALPPEAMARLQEMTGQTGTFGAGGLSVNAAALVQQAGYLPLGQVMGCSVFHIGFQWRNPNWRDSDRKKMGTEGISFEMDIMTQAFYQARHLAMSRMQQEAALLGATGVAGVHLTHKKTEDQEDVLEFVALGTAIRVKGRQSSKTTPFLSNLSAAELWQLEEAGFRPVGLAVGNCTYFMMPDWNTQQLIAYSALTRQGRQNQELPHMTQAVYAARELAMQRMESEAREFGARGIVGATVEVEASMSNEHSEAVATTGAVGTAMLAHFLAIGTAIAPAISGHDLDIEAVLIAR